MIRLIGVIISILMGSYIGIMKSKHYARRVKELESCKIMCQKINTLLSYESPPTSRLICDLAGTQSLKELTFLAECAELLKEDYDFPSAWKKAVEMKKQESCLNASDLSLLIQLCDVIGASDAEGQISTVKMYQALFEQNHSEAQAEYQSKGKLCRSLGVLIGVAFGIMFV